MNRETGQWEFYSFYLKFSSLTFKQNNFYSSIKVNIKCFIFNSENLEVIAKTKLIDEITIAKK